MADSIFEDSFDSIRGIVKKEITINSDGSRTAPTDILPMILAVATHERLQKLEQQFNTISKNQEKILAALERLENPPSKTKRAVKPPPANS